VGKKKVCHDQGPCGAKGELRGGKTS